MKFARECRSNGDFGEKFCVSSNLNYVTLVSREMTKTHYDADSGHICAEDYGTILDLAIDLELRLPRASALKYIVPENNLSQITDDVINNLFLALNESSINPAFEHVKEVKVTPNSLVILHPGMYYIYASVVYNLSLPLDTLNKTLYLHLHRTSPTEEASSILATSAHTCCARCHQAVQTAYTSHLRQLEAGDSLQVSVSGPGHVLENFKLDSQSSFIGVTTLAADIHLAQIQRKYI
ncbi:uncharacterized protein LOC131936506 isoform X2 [Physella acuta]|uniref:uncharacterized protein LOC131936506 isoform X2 n=1 Tax=Physella acuta TaxID=109671 RepID=UPI0027DC4666|nr:uncharacterized protein LOC131936506 isoform X2 [Physella acuta]